MLKMALAVSLRRALLMLLTTTIFVLMVLYWNQGVIKPHSFINTLEKTIRTHNEYNVMPIPTEKMWTYKCEGDKCVRYHYLFTNYAEKRVPYLTCSMTCGGINIWPHPTIKTAVSSKSFRFSAENIQLQLESPYTQVQLHFEHVFDIFQRDLRRLQRLDFIHLENNENVFSSSETNANGNKARERHNDNARLGAGVLGPLSATTVNNMHENAGNTVRHAHSDIDNFKVHVIIQKFAELQLNFDTDESYQLSIEFDKRKLNAQIMANSFFGARHALSTLQQLIWYDDEDALLRVLSKAIIIDAPRFRYRGIMLDTSRHYFSVGAIKRTIMAMGHAKLNRFHWHITDSQSFPYISKHYPEMASHGAYSDRETYTSEDLREVTEFARLHGVQVIPEIDAPAHAGNGWDWGPKRGLGDLALCINQQPWAFYCGEPPCGQLNPKNNHTFLILQRLYEELLNLTGPTDYFHLGGDEVNLECWGQYFNDTDLRGLWCDFMLNAVARLKIANHNVVPKYIAVWSSGLTNTKCFSKNQFVVHIWGGSTWQENYDLLDNGYNVIFSHVDAWYLDCGFGNWRSTGEGACSPYRTWQVVYKHRPWERMRLDKSRKKQVLGGEACMWTEQVDEPQLDSRLWPRAAALGERLWSDPEDEHDADIVSQETFRRMGVFRNRLVDLGVAAEPIFPKYCYQNPGECI